MATNNTVQGLASRSMSLKGSPEISRELSPEFSDNQMQLQSSPNSTDHDAVGTTVNMVIDKPAVITAQTTDDNLKIISMDTKQSKHGTKTDINIKDTKSETKICGFLPVLSWDTCISKCLDKLPTEHAVRGNQNCVIRRKDCCQFCSLIIIFGSLLAYFIYQLTIFCSPNKNKVEIVEIVEQEEFPYPYLFLSWNFNWGESYWQDPLFVDGFINIKGDSSYRNNKIGYITTNLKYNISNNNNNNNNSPTVSPTPKPTSSYAITTTQAPSSQPTQSLSPTSPVEYETFNNNFIKMSKLLNNNKNKWIIVFADNSGKIESVESNYTQIRIQVLEQSGQILIIPPEYKYERIKAGYTENSGNNGNTGNLLYLTDIDSLQVKMLFEEKVDTNIVGQNAESVSKESRSLFDLGARESLKNSKTLYEVFDNVYTRSQLLIGGYLTFIDYDYEWYDYNNNVKGSNGYNSDKQYFVTKFGGTYQDNNHPFYLVIKPDHSRKKTVFKTNEKMTFWDVISNVGGFYTPLAGIFGVLCVSIIWGFNIKICTFSGIDKDAPVPDSIVDEKRIEQYIEKHYSGILKKKLGQLEKN